jgi:hypothetical protein
MLIVELIKSPDVLREGVTSLGNFVGFAEIVQAAGMSQDLVRFETQCGILGPLVAFLVLSTRSVSGSFVMIIACLAI